jgi:enamine deaminase RidA (YjgF/YER057c/UK114 family)
MDNRNKDTESGLRFVNPPGLYNPAPNGYSHLALFPKGWRIILPAGQGGETEEQCLSEDFATQLKQAVRNTDALIGFQGLT